LSQPVHSLARASAWLLDSGIQSDNGGVARFYRTDLARNNPISTEITGYHASALIYLHSLTGDARLLDRAIHTARFLTTLAWDAGLRTFPFEYPDSAHAYFFDCGIIIRGLLSVWRATRDRAFLDAARACGDGMLTDFDAGFDFHPVLDLPSKSPALRDPRWSRSSGCYQLKVALGWFELYEETAEEKFHDAYRRMQAQALASHEQFLPGHTDPERVMDRLHAYCYFLEAMLPVLPHAALAIGIQRVSHLLHTIAPAFARSDVYAQLLRMRLYAAAEGVLALDSHTAAIEAESLARFQAQSPDPRIDGGFWFGGKRGEMLPYVNPVSTVFGIQALEMWRTFHQTGRLPDRTLLI
jgi:hypothetical protein